MFLQAEVVSDFKSGYAYTTRPDVQAPHNGTYRPSIMVGADGAKSGTAPYAQRLSTRGLQYILR